MESDSKSVTINQGLFKDREKIEKGSVSRGAPVFPIFNLRNNNLIPIFQDYWKWERALNYENATAYSWRIKVNKGKMGSIYCLSYNSTIGCIYGEHSF